MITFTRTRKIRREAEFNLACPVCGKPYRKITTPMYDNDTGKVWGIISKFEPDCDCPVAHTLQYGVWEQTA